MPILHSRKYTEGPNFFICMGISLCFVLARFFLARILSDGLPTISGVRSVSDQTPEEISEQKIEVFIGKNL